MPGTLGQLGRPGQAQRALLVTAELAARDALHPVGRVRQQQLLARGRARVLHLQPGLLRRARPQQRVLAERKAVPVRQRVDESVVRVAAQVSSAWQAFAAVGDERVAGHVRGVVREQEAGQLPGLLGGADAPQRDEPRHFGQKALAARRSSPRPGC